MKSFIIAAIILSSSACQTADPVEAEQYANGFIKHIEGATSVSCAKNDTDRDGYIACTVFRGKEEPLAIECGAEKWCIANCATDCRMMTFKIRGGK